MPELLTIAQVARKYAQKEHLVRYAIRVGHIKAHKLGWIWLIEHKDLPEKWGEWKEGAACTKPS